MEMTKEEVSRTHRENFYGALQENDLEKLTQIYSDRLHARETRRGCFQRRRFWTISKPLR